MIVPTPCTIYRCRYNNADGMKLCKPKQGVKRNYAYFPVLFDGFKMNRDEVFEKLKSENIYARKYFYPLTNDFKCYENRFDADETPVAKYVAERILTLPMYADLDLADVARICDIILSKRCSNLVCKTD